MTPESASAAPLEVEAKLLVPNPTGLRAIARLERVGAYRLQPRGRARLHTLYLDTRELTLARNGVALRVRRSGRQWEATAKWGGRVDGAVHERPEINVPLAGVPPTPFSLPSGPLRIHLAALVAGRPLLPILMSEIQRQLFDVLGPADREDGANEPIAELALDRVYLGPPDGPRTAGVSYCEAEIELRHGAAGDIVELAGWLQQQFGLQSSPDSKFARGMAVVAGERLLAPPQPMTIDSRDTVDVAVGKIVGEQLRRLRVQDPGTRIGADPETLHDFRVAIRRLRAAVRLFETGIPVRLRERFATDLSWLGTSSNAVRDIDVQLVKLAQYRGVIADELHAGLASLIAHLESERTQRRAELLRVLDSSRYLRLLVRLERFAATAPNRSSRVARPERFAAIARRALKRAFNRVLRRGQRIAAEPRPEDLHTLRIRAKRLRYLLEFVRDLTGKPGRRVVKRLVRLQDVLGAHHDAVVAAAHIREYGERGGAQTGAKVLLALGVLMGHEQRLAEEARADFHRVWSRFTSKRAQKDGRDLQRRLASYATEDNSPTDDPRRLTPRRNEVTQ
ncbi:MAG TPA: CHAD domain-containing protein [Candidatus Binatia bacterium]|nr:CHAD domain-containing protein [Candidatus Binatia bacterium]